MEESKPSSLAGQTKSSRYDIKVLFKALKITDALRQERAGLRLVDIAEALQMSKTTALRILFTLQRTGSVYRDPRTKRFKMSLGYHTYKVGYAQLWAGQPFSDAVTHGLVEEAKRSYVDLVIADNGYSEEKALRNVEWMIEQRVDFAIEYQIHYKLAPVIAHHFSKAKIPTLAIDIPQPGAVYFGVNNYAAGLTGGGGIGALGSESLASTSNPSTHPRGICGWAHPSRKNEWNSSWHQKQSSPART